MRSLLASLLLVQLHGMLSRAEEDVEDLRTLNVSGALKFGGDLVVLRHFLESTSLYRDPVATNPGAGSTPRTGDARQTAPPPRSAIPKPTVRISRQLRFQDGDRQPRRCHE